MARRGQTKVRMRTGHSLSNELDAVPALRRPKFHSDRFACCHRSFFYWKRDKPVHLGSRALEILIVLLERPGELITKQELLARVWPNIFVEPANLTVHISALRRTLRDGRDGNRFIINIPGRGYGFVGDVTAGVQRP